MVRRIASPVPLVPLRRRWLSALLWSVIWTGVFFTVFRWGMWWWLGSTWAMASAYGLLLARTGQVLCARPVLAPPPPRIIRRIIIEEERYE
jgi:NhaP-type Na+/H+ or K+/H+ antiporter